MIHSAAIVPPLPRTAVPEVVSKPASTGSSETTSLTRGLAAGNEEAFRAFHAAYFDRLLRYLLVVTQGDEFAARDALQETLTRVVRHARRFDEEEAFWSWLTVLARSAVIDGGRKQQRYWRLLTRYSLFWMRSGPVSSDETQVDEHLELLLAGELEGLDPIDRVLINGKYFRRATLRELAGETHLTERAVESRLRRARQQLREKILQRLKDENRS